MKVSKTTLFSAISLILLPVLVSAMWSGVLTTNTAISTGELDWEIVPGTVVYLDACGLQPGYGFFRGNDWNATYLPLPGALQLDKDVGCTDVTLIDSDGDGDKDTMNVTLYNVYPWYYTHVAFKVHNDGTIPLKIWRVIIGGQEYYELNEQELEQGVELDLTGDGKPDVLIWWGDNFGVQLHPSQSADISFDVTVLQDAPEGSTLTFTVSFEAVQWNEYTVPTVTTPPVLTATISGYVWNDNNGNGVWDEDEPPLSGVVILLVQDTTVINETVTDECGFYKFTVTPGTYTINATLLSGYVFTTPSTITVTVVAGGASVDNNFGMWSPPPPPKLSVSKEFRETDTYFWRCGLHRKAYLGTPLSQINATVKDGKVKNVNPGVMYGVIWIIGEGVTTANITDTFDYQFNVHDHEGKVRVFIYNISGQCIVRELSSSGRGREFTYSIDNTANIVTVNITLGDTLLGGQAILVYIKFDPTTYHPKNEPYGLIGNSWVALDKFFENSYIVETNIGSASGTASIEIVRK